MNRLDKIKQEFLEQFQNKLDEEKVDISVESAFDILVSADPSRNKKNVRWLIETYLNDGYLFEDISSGKHSKVHDTLNIFIRNKNKLDIVDRSINRYQSIADMWKMVKQYADDKTGKEVKRDEYDKAMAESEMVIDNDDIRVVVPLTEYAAKFHGRGTRWCTAADNNNMFWNYAKDAPLFIITLKESGEKLQLWASGDDVQFMDSDDKRVTIDCVEYNWNLLKNIIIHSGVLLYTPPEYITPELCESAVKRSGLNLCYVPDMTPDGILLKTTELCKLACEQDGLALMLVPDELRTPELCKIAVKQNGLALDFVPDVTPEGVTLRTPELCKIAVEQNSLSLEDVPEEYKTLELCRLAVEQNGAALQFVPDMTSDGMSLKTSEICTIAVKQNGMALKYVPEELITSELCRLACETNGISLQFVPDMTPDGVPLKTYELCKLACQKDGLALEYVPIEYMTPELCKIAVEQNGHALYYVPKRHMKSELFEIAVNQYSLVLEHVPEEYRTPELYDLVSQQDEDVFYEIPTEVYKQEIDKLKELFMDYAQLQKNIV